MFVRLSLLSDLCGESAALNWFLLQSLNRHKHILLIFKKAK